MLAYFMNKLLIVCGPTATGKTALGITLANNFYGEIISADSRQVYRGMDIGTGKDIPQNSELKSHNSKLGIENEKFTVGFRRKEGVPIWLVDIVEPDYVFNLGEYAEFAKRVIVYLWSKNKLPIVVGGTGLYIKALLQPFNHITISPDSKLRKRLDKLNLFQMQEELQKVDIQKWRQMNESDRQNPRRLIRAIEIATSLMQTKPIDKLFNHVNHKGMRNSISEDVLVIGLTASTMELYRRIDARVDERVKRGAEKEVMTLVRRGYHWELPAMSALGYREWKEYLEKISNFQFPISNIEKERLKKEVVQQWKYDEHAYARRQLTWFKKMANIHWFDITLPNFRTKVIVKVDQWYNT